jgi:putative IMPACT (imprinted ancient) family translation regulator
MEGKNDDGEAGAGQIILAEMKRVNAVDMIIVVTRYFG